MTEEDDNGPSLNPSTLAMLREFAQERGAEIDENEKSDAVLSSIHSFFALSKEDRKEIFNVDYTSADGLVHVEFEVEGVRRDLGQTLDSTGLTIWRAAEHLCQYIVDNRQLFSEKRVCELGSGLGMVSILLDKAYVNQSQYLPPPIEIVVTDGDDDTMTLLSQNIESTHSSITPMKLYWNDFQSEYWSKRLAENNMFDVIIAADVIYEKEQVKPLIASVGKLLKRSYPQGIFYLAFARRNVPIDLVLVEADASGLVTSVVDQNGTEPIYSFTWR